MQKGFAIWLILGALFALWLYNTGRVASFKNWLMTNPAQPTLPGAVKTAAAGGSSGADPVKVAQCGAQAAEGIVTADCLSVFGQAVSNPGKVVASAVKTLTFGVVKL